MMWTIKMLLFYLLIVNVGVDSNKKTKAPNKIRGRTKSEKFNIADILTEIQDRLHVGPGETRSNEELMVLYDPDDLMVILPDFPIVYDPLVAIQDFRGFVNSFSNPPLASMESQMEEAYTYNYNGQRMAYAFCFNIGRAADGTVLYVARVMQRWKKFGKMWKIQRDYASFEPQENIANWS